MRIQRISAAYFSPTGTTKSVAERIAEKVSEQLTASLFEKTQSFDFTLPQMRQVAKRFSSDELVVFGMPVYAGRLPNVLLKYLETPEGNGAFAVPVVLYGNRNYDDALKELWQLLERKNFRIIAAAAFIGEHSFSQVLGKGRPDDADMSIADDFAARVSEKISQNDYSTPVLPGYDEPLKGYYQPRDCLGNAIDIRKVTPKVSNSCTGCGYCAEICPMGAIDPADIHAFVNICIKCGACEKKCPVGARYYDDENYLYHKTELEKQYTRRAEPELFL